MYTVFVFVFVTVFVCLFVSVSAYNYSGDTYRPLKDQLIKLVFVTVFLRLFVQYYNVSVSAYNHSCFMTHSGNPPFQGILVKWLNADQTHIYIYTLGFA